MRQCACLPVRSFQGTLYGVRGGLTLLWEEVPKVNPESSMSKNWTMDCCLRACIDCNVTFDHLIENIICILNPKRFNPHIGNNILLIHDDNNYNYHLALGAPAGNHAMSLWGNPATLPLCHRGVTADLFRHGTVTVTHIHSVPNRRQNEERIQGGSATIYDL